MHDSQAFLNAPKTENLKTINYIKIYVPFVI